MHSEVIRSAAVSCGIVGWVPRIEQYQMGYPQQILSPPSLALTIDSRWCLLAGLRRVVSAFRPSISTGPELLEGIWKHG